MKKQNQKLVEGEKMTLRRTIKKYLPSIITACFMFAIMLNGPVFADEPATSTAEVMWDKVMTLMQTWVLRLGLVVVFVGAVMFGLGFKNDDAEAKTRGINTMVAGGIVAAATTLITNLLSSATPTA